jgi:hypothetical protein
MMIFVVTGMEKLAELQKKERGLDLKCRLPSFYILQHNYDMPAHIACSGQHRGVHIPEHKHCIHLRTDCKIALQIGCP